MNESSVAVSVAYFWANSTGYSSVLHVAFRTFQNLKNLILNILKEKFSCLAGSFFVEPA